MKLNSNYVCVKLVDQGTLSKKDSPIILSSDYSSENPLVGRVVFEGKNAADQFENGSNLVAKSGQIQSLLDRMVIFPRGSSTKYYTDVNEKNSEVHFLEARFIYAVID